MRIAYFGTPDFAVAPLTALSKYHEIMAVFTRPDSVSGRGGALLQTPVANAARELGLASCKISSLFELDKAELFEFLSTCDIAVVVAFGELIPTEVLKIPRYGFVNLHASLLPRWRGAAPVQRSILAGDAKAGISVMRIVEGLDAGPYCAQAATEIGEKSCDQLLTELSGLGAKILARALDDIQDDCALWVEQDDSKVTYAHKILKTQLAPSPDLGAIECARRIQASTDSAPARAIVCGKYMRIMRATANADPVDSPEALRQGAVIRTRKRILLGCADGPLELLEVKPDGKRSMQACAFLSGLDKAASCTWSGV